jgi:hypothetical protein
MRSLGLTPRDYAAFARADQGVLAAHKWFDMAGYEQMWQQRLGGNAEQGASNGVGARYAYQDYTAPAEPAMFDWWVEVWGIGGVGVQCLLCGVHLATGYGLGCCLASYPLVAWAKACCDQLIITH